MQPALLRHSTFKPFVDSAVVAASPHGKCVVILLYFFIEKNNIINIIIIIIISIIIVVESPQLVCNRIGGSIIV